MIIGINGYIMCGKDTVGKIIQYLKSDFYPNKSFNRFLEKENSDWGPPYTDWEIKKFAGKLKQIASLMTGIPVEKFEDQEFKKTYLGEEWDYFEGFLKSCTPSEKLDSFLEGKKQMTVREFMQKLGTESVRNYLHPNAWVNALFADYKEEPTNVLKSEGYHLEDLYPNWIITDTRFPNEAQAIKDRGGIVIRVNRNFDDIEIGENKIRALINPINLHSSETALDDWEFDYVLENDRTIEELIEEVKKMLKHFNL